MNVARAEGRPALARPLLLAAKMVLSLGLMVVPVRAASRSAELGATAARARARRWLAAAAGLLLASNVLGAWQWQRLLRAVEIRIPFWKVLSYYHVGLFFNNFLPANVGGDFARVLDASRYGPSRAAALLDRDHGPPDRHAWRWPASRWSPRCPRSTTSTSGRPADLRRLPRAGRASSRSASA